MKTSASLEPATVSVRLMLFDCSERQPYGIRDLALGGLGRAGPRHGGHGVGQGRYPAAIDQFIAVMVAAPDCAEAFHNGGLAYANMGTDGLAVQALLKACDLYDRQSTKAGLDLVKHQLEQIAGRQGLNPRSAA